MRGKVDYTLRGAAAGLKDYKVHVRARGARVMACAHMPTHT